MAYTVTNLITDAFHLAGIVSREFQTVSGHQLEVGLRDLNNILAERTTDKSMIPYYSEYVQALTAGQETYTIADLIEVSTATYAIGTTRYAMQPAHRDRYFGSARANNVSSLPYTYHVERQFGGANVYLYFLPADGYNMTIWGKFRLASVAYNQDLELTLDRFYTSYLTFALAKRLCNSYTYTVPPDVNSTLNGMEIQISKISAPLDMTTRFTSVLSTASSAPNYAIVNFGGWTTFSA